MQTIQPTKRKQYAYLKPAVFNGVKGSSKQQLDDVHCGWTFVWNGIHPRAPYLEYNFSISEEFRHVCDGATHEIAIECRILNSSGFKILYMVQLNLCTFSNPTVVAEQLLCAMVIYLLNCRNPKTQSGITEPPTQGRSTWSIVLEETIRGIELQHL